MSVKTKKAGYEDYLRAAVQSLQAGHEGQAFDYACTALKFPQADHTARVIVALTAHSIKVLKFDPVIRDAILNVLGYDYIDNNMVLILWLQMLEIDPALSDMAKKIKTGNYEEKDWSKIEQALNDDFFIEGLRHLTMMTTNMEVFLRRVRKSLLLELYPKKILKTKNMAFICALAEQCFFNEYNYFVTEEEKEALKSLSKNDPISVAILGCYEPLHDHNINVKLSAVSSFKKMISSQVQDPLRELELMKTIKSFSTIENDITKNVQAMYEQNPYPRWKSIDMPTMSKSNLAGDVLIAGCGTGRTATQVGFLHPHINVTACDISRRSIAYAMRMAEKFGNKSVSFEHRDIMTFSHMTKKFDFIECSGVLHHMADPVAGWQKLIDRLTDGGYMIVCLYSTKARANIQAVRELVAQKGLSPTPENIRLLRLEIIDDELHPLRKIITNRDFYSLSETRDLVFHIQEKTYTMLEIKKIMDDLGLELVRLKITDNVTKPKYKEKYPEDLSMTNFENWDKFEDDYPDTFIGMYKFICKKRGDDVVNKNALDLVNTAYGD